MVISRPGMDVSWPKEENSGSDFSLELPVSPRVYEPDLQSPRSGRRQSRSFVEQKGQIHFNLQRQFREFVRSKFKLLALLCLDEIPVTYKSHQQESNEQDKNQKQLPKLGLRNFGQIRLGSRQIDRLYSYLQYIPQCEQGERQQLQLNGNENAKLLNDPIRILVQKRGGISIDEVVSELEGMDWQWGWVDRVGSRTIEDRTRGTLVLGQDELGFEGQLRIIGCRDIVVYALSSVSHVLIKACSGCTICIGAVGGIIRMEDCQKVELHVACRRILLNSCQQCTVYMGTQERPVVLGDCRFLVVAPHNSPYEHLQRHVSRAQISTSTNKWDNVMYGRRMDVKSKQISSSQQPLNHSLLPSDKFLPFYVPFRGTQGPLAGGASARTKTLQQPLFPLPNDYEKAMNRTMKTVEIIRERTKAARASDARGLELQSTIQQHFREWMIMTGRIKQIQDLAKLERDKIKKHENTEDTNK